MVRFKNRYFLFEIVWGETGRVPSGLSQQLVIRAVRDSVAAHFGDVGTGVTASTLQSTRGILKTCATDVFLVDAQSSISTT